MYEDWIDGYKFGKLLIIDADTLKVSEKPEDLGLVIEKINAQLHGLF